MTQNGIAYLNYLEGNRHNVVVEKETERSNLAREAETIRSNVAREIENQRSNMAREALTRQSNLITESHYLRMDDETKRHNIATEAETFRNNTINNMMAIEDLNYKYAALSYDTQLRSMQNQISAYDAESRRMQASANYKNAETNMRLADIRAKDVDNQNERGWASIFISAAQLDINKQNAENQAERWDTQNRNESLRVGYDIDLLRSQTEYNKKKTQNIEVENVINGVNAASNAVRAVKPGGK